MHNFDLRKFLAENRPTSVSKDRLDEFEFRTVDRSNIGNFTDKDSKDFMTGAGEEQDQRGITSLAHPVLNAKVASLVFTVKENPNAFSSVKQEIVKGISSLKINKNYRRQLLDQVQEILHAAVLQKWYNNNVLQESNIMNNFDLKKYLTENKLTTNSNRVVKENQSLQQEQNYEEDDTTTTEIAEEEVMDDSTHNNEGVSRYLSLESAEEVIKELEKDVNKATMEAKLSKMKEVIEAIEAKADSLEEDAGLKGFISPKKLSEMRKMTKKLRIMQERYVKEYDKKFKSKTKMNESTSLLESSIRKLVREALGRK